MAVSVGVSLVEIQTVLSLQDVHNLLEVAMVDAHNDRIWRKWAREQSKGR